MLMYKGMAITTTNEIFQVAWLIIRKDRAQIPAVLKVYGEVVVHIVFRLLFLRILTP